MFDNVTVMQLNQQYIALKLEQPHLSHGRVPTKKASDGIFGGLNL